MSTLATVGIGLAAGLAANPYLEPRMLGAIGLVLAAAGLAGTIVYRLLPWQRGALSLSFLAAFATVAGLAYAGIEAAGAVMWVCLAVLLVAWIIAVLSNA